MRALETIVIFLLLSVFYKILPTDDRHLFLFSEAVTNWQYFVWVIIMRFMLVFFAWMYSFGCEEVEKNVVRSFAVLMLAKNIDFILCGNSMYFGIEWLTFNTISIFVFCTYQIVRLWKSLYTQSLY